MSLDYTAKNKEERAALRGDRRRCIASLRACKELAGRMAVSAGVSTPLSMEEEALLQAFHRVLDAHEGYAFEGAFDQLRREAGLLPSDVGLLTGRVLTLFMEREPVLYQAEVQAALYQWLTNRRSDEPEHHE